MEWPQETSWHLENLSFQVGALLTSRIHLCQSCATKMPSLHKVIRSNPTSPSNPSSTWRFRYFTNISQFTPFTQFTPQKFLCKNHIEKTCSHMEAHALSELEGALTLVTGHKHCAGSMRIGSVWSLNIPKPLLQYKKLVGQECYCRSDTSTFCPVF